VPVRLSPNLAGLPRYVPGRNVPGAIKLASNETPYPPLPHVLARILESAQNVNRYPDSSSVALAARIAERFDVTPGQVAIGAGSVSLCTQLVQACAGPGDEVLFAWRSFEAYPIITALAGATAVTVPLREQVHDLAAMADQITERTRLIFVCNPNNPTGTVVRRADLLAFLARVPGDVAVALDEAYFEFIRDPETADGMALLTDFPNLVVLRTFSKAYGLAGLRIGYAVAADAEVARALRSTQIPFAITQVGQDAALASLEAAAQPQLTQRVAELVDERYRVRTELREMGYDVPASESNFVWLPLGETTLDWASGCADRKVIVRPYTPDGVRVTIGSAEENDRLLEAARELVATG
jgi:histidinol-phosphate aminotransferase